MPSTASGVPTDDAMTSATTKLESDLDYMLKFLELGAGNISEQLRDAILKIVKETLTWKKGERTIDQIQAKTKALSDTMTDLLQKHTSGNPANAHKLECDHRQQQDE